MDKDGRFKVGDELINVNGHSLRGLSMEAARNVLRQLSGPVDIIGKLKISFCLDMSRLVFSISVARQPEDPNLAGNPAGSGPKPNLAALKKKRRRRLPVLERPKSAPISGEILTTTGSLCNSEDDSVMDVCDFSDKKAAMKTVIKVTDSSGSSTSGTGSARLSEPEVSTRDSGNGSSSAFSDVSMTSVTSASRLRAKVTASSNSPTIRQANR